MAKIPDTFDLGQSTGLNDEVLRYLQQMYTQLATAINQKADVYERSTDGLTSDTSLANGSLNINSSTNKVEMLTNHTATAVTWTQLS